jgi:TetR/AcrR family transcriptional repressor of nem operon
MFGKSIRWDMAQLLQNYLTEAYRDVPGTGCAMGALPGDMTRGSKSARALYTARVKRSQAFSSALLPSRPRSDKRGRAVSDPGLSREIFYGVRDQLISLVNPGQACARALRTPEPG